jgi:hypothetical protein
MYLLNILDMFNINIIISGYAVIPEHEIMKEREGGGAFSVLALSERAW